MESVALLIAATLSAGTVLAFAALGLLINERAGVVNLGAEGMMLVAAIAGYVRWRTTRWWVTPAAIHHRTGLLRKKETDVPLNRVQALDLGAPGTPLSLLGREG